MKVEKQLLVDCKVAYVLLKNRKITGVFEISPKFKREKDRTRVQTVATINGVVQSLTVCKLFDGILRESHIRHINSEVDVI